VDVLIKENIDKIIARHPENFKVHYMVTKGDSDWSGLTGHITKETLE
jgi:NAD(P)H-flavin reductase